MTGQFQLIHGNSLEELAKLPTGSVDACVTDPPYELGFMGKKWDASGIAYNVELWRQVFRALKPGGHVAAFGGTRTYHRMAVAIEDAGFDIRDQLAWVYGSGFPKSLDVSKALDKAAGAERPVVGERSVVPGVAFEQSTPYATGRVTVPVTVPARAYSGWGTALKPSWEPICLARKPLIGTVAANVLTHGTGGLNIDACRVPAEKMVGYGGASNQGSYGENFGGKSGFTNPNPNPNRWPANLVHDGSDEVVCLFPGEAGGSSGAKETAEPNFKNTIYGKGLGVVVSSANQHDDSGSAARFFYTAKASTSDREAGIREAAAGVGALRDGGRGAKRGNSHPTVKPTDLMVWLVKLITPLGGTVVDPFMGSGSTGRAAAICNMNFIGIDLTAEYIPIAKARIDEARGELFTQ